jgi:nitroreductase
VDTWTRLVSFDRNGMLGELTGVSPADIERLFRTQLRADQAALADNRRLAQMSGSEICLDASRSSGTNGGDVWRISPNGSIRRELLRFPQAEDILLASPASDVTSSRPNLAIAQPLLMRCAYSGLWSPSGTNWQPIRSVELTGVEASDLMGQPVEGCGLLVMTRSAYDSVLSDVANLCGITHASHAEWIDLGIWLLVATMTARAHGWKLNSLPIPTGQRNELTQRLDKLLSRRLNKSPVLQQAPLLAFLESLRRGEHVPAYLLVPQPGRELLLAENAPGGLQPTEFDRLVEARSTQRVASPAGELPRSILFDLWQTCLRALPHGTVTTLAIMSFTRTDKALAHIGQAMAAGIEGSECQPGLLQRASVAALQNYLCSFANLPAELAAWTRCNDSERERQAQDLALPADLIPRHLLAALCEGGHFQRDGDLLKDHRGRPVSPARLMKLVKLMARSFGRFFLSFQNTHPLLGVVLARRPSSGEDDPRIFQLAGQVVAHMTLLARARGLASIIKSGPLEIAREAICKILAEEAAEPELRSQISAGQLEPLLMFQVGLPLGPDELVCAGTPDEHLGLNERQLDRRAGRAPLGSHYFPAFE